MVARIFVGAFGWWDFRKYGDFGYARASAREAAMSAARLNRIKRMIRHAQILIGFDEDGPYAILAQAMFQVNLQLRRVNRGNRFINGRVMRHWCTDCVRYENARGSHEA